MLSSNEEKETLWNFFKKKPSNFELLYRASEHNFSGPKYRELCHGKGNTLVLIKTATNKIIGGFTPVPWDMNAQGVQLGDPSSKSFIFSVTEKDKFELLESKKNLAVWHSNQCGPCFGTGSPDLYLSNQSNINNCYANKS